MSRLGKRLERLKELLPIGKTSTSNAASDKPTVILSSCRLEGLSPNSYIHKVHHTHNTKEVIQYLGYINGDIDIDKKMHRYIFRSCYLKNRFSVNREKLRKEFHLSDTVFIELCSRKKYVKNGYFIHHLAADKGDAASNNSIENETRSSEYELTIQSKDEIESDILEIARLLQDKKVVFVTHIDYGIEVRKELINEIAEICNKHNLFYIDPSDKLDVLKNEMKDSNHYSSRGLQILADYILEKVGDERASQ